jgi:hypothetical protein
MNDGPVAKAVGKEQGGEIRKETGKITAEFS